MKCVHLSTLPVDWITDHSCVLTDLIYLQIICEVWFQRNPRRQLLTPAVSAASVRLFQCLFAWATVSFFGNTISLHISLLISDCCFRPWLLQQSLFIFRFAINKSGLNDNTIATNSNEIKKNNNPRFYQNSNAAGVICFVIAKWWFIYSGFKI